MTKTISTAASPLDASSLVNRSAHSLEDQGLHNMLILLFKAKNILPPEYLRKFKLKDNKNNLRGQREGSKLKEARLIPPGRRDSHIKGAGMLVGNFHLIPQRRPIWAWSRLFLLTPKRDHIKTKTNMKT